VSGSLSSVSVAPTARVVIWHFHSLCGALGEWDNVSHWTSTPPSRCLSRAPERVFRCPATSSRVVLCHWCSALPPPFVLRGLFPLLRPSAPFTNVWQRRRDILHSTTDPTSQSPTRSSAPSDFASITGANPLSKRHPPMGSAFAKLIAQAVHFVR
jgi:hypothetical protein